MGPEGQMPDGTPVARTLVAWPGGRGLRDMGDDPRLVWGDVRVFEPPTRLAIVGRLCTTYRVASHRQYRLTAEGKQTKLALVHQAIGLIQPQHAESVNKGWEFMNDHVRRIAE